MSQTFQLLTPKQLTGPLGIVSKILNPRHPIPILAGILFELHRDEKSGDYGSITVTACDLDQTVSVTVPQIQINDNETEKAESLPEPDFAFVAPREIVKIISLLPDDRTIFNFYPENMRLEIEYGRGFKSRQELAVMDAEEYPPKPIVKGTSFNFSGEDGDKIDFKRVSFAASKEEARPIFQGVCFDFARGNLVATDTHRLAVLAAGELQNLAAEGLQNIVAPVKAINFLGELDDPQITVSNSESQIVFTEEKEGGEKIVMASRLLAGQYPNYVMIVPDKSRVVAAVQFNAGECAKAIERATVVQGKDARIDVAFDSGGDGVSDNTAGNAGSGFSGKNIMIIGGRSEENKVVEEIECEFVAGSLYDLHDGFVITMSPRYLLDALKHSGAEEVVWEITGYNTPGVIRGADDGDDWYCVIVPMISVSQV